MHLRVLAISLVTATCVAAQSDASGSAPDADTTRGDQFFYFPTHDQPATPAKWGFRYEDAYFKSKDGTSLHAWLIQNHGEQAKGTVVFSHGATGSMGHHMGFVLWLAEAGYRVLMYDYRGYGKSKGRISRRGLVDDTKAAFQFVASHPDLKSLPIISYGHSLGGAKSITALAETEIDNVQAIIIDASFSSYRNMAGMIGGRLALSLVSDELAPVDNIAKLSPTPLLVVHGKLDPVVPASEAQRLFKAAGKPKTLYLVEKGNHGNSLARDDGAYRKQLLKWLDIQLDEARH